MIRQVGFGAKDIRFDQAQYGKRMFEGLKDLSSRVYQPDWWKGGLPCLSSEDITTGGESHGQNLSFNLGRTGMILKFQPFSAPVAKQPKATIQKMGARPLRRVLQTEVEDRLAELLKGQVKKGKRSRLEQQPERSSSRLSRGTSWRFSD